MSKNWYTELWTDDCGFQIAYDEKIITKQSPYQKIDFYKSKTFGTFFTLDDLMMVNQKDEFIYHEMIVHPSFAINPEIKDVLIIGGGDGGTAREVLRYAKVEKLHMVEIDEMVFRMCQQYLPQTAKGVEEDQRMQLYFEDGLAFVKQTKPATYDLILVDSTDPVSIGEGLFTNEFYENCYRILKDKGILINQHESPYFEKYANEMQKAQQKIKKTFENTAVYQFHMPTYPSGHWLFGFASKHFDPIKNHDPKMWAQYNLKTKYYNANIHKGAFALPTYVEEKLNEKK